MRKSAYIFSAALAFALAGCGDDGETSCNGGGGDNRLEGSYCEQVEMVFTEARLRKQGTFLLIEYVRPIGTGLEKTLIVTLDTDGLMIVPGERLDFLASGGTARRVLTDATVNLTPELDPTSTIQLDTWTGDVGSPIAGRVDLSFASGRKLSAVFSGTLVESTPMM